MREYVVTIAGVEHTVQCGQAEAERLGLVHTKVSAPAHNKATPAPAEPKPPARRGRARQR